MMTETKRKALFWTFKILSILVSIAFPIWAIIDRFPLWKESQGTGKTVGMGLILILVVVVIVFRKAVFEFISAKLDVKHAPPLVIWIVLIIISYILVYFGKVMQDLNIVFWMGFIGCAIGNVLTYIAQRFSEPSVKEAEKQ